MTDAGSLSASSITVTDRARPFSTLGFTIPRGSLDDPEGKPGVAWLTSQMMLRGSTGWSRQAIADALEGLGSVVDLSVGRDHTMLWADALTRKRPALLDHLEHILRHPTFPEDELDKLKRETIADLQAVRDDDTSLGLRFFVRALYGDHPYGRALKGGETSIAAITRDDLIAFQRGWSREGSLLGLAGDVDPAHAPALADRLRATLGSGPRSALPFFQRPPPRSDGRWNTIIIDKPERSQVQVFLGHVALDAQSGNGAGVHHPDWTALQIGQTTFGGTFTSRFSHEIREKRGWSYGAWSQLSADQRLATFIVRYYPAVKDLLASLQLTDELLSSFVASGPTDAELDTAQSYLQNGFVFAIDTAARRLSELVSARLLGHPDGWLDDTVERLRRVPHADPVRAVKQHLRPDEMVLAIVGTAKEIEPQLAAWPRVGDIKVIDWKTPL